jgi:hypothetical protein
MSTNPRAKTTNSSGYANITPYQWKPGQSGNPLGVRGGPKPSVIKQLIKVLVEQDTSDTSLPTKSAKVAAELYRIATTPGPQQLEAIKVILERIDGKVLQRVEIEGNALRAKCLACVDFLRDRARSQGVEVDELLVLQAVAAEYPEARDVLAAEFEAAEQRANADAIDTPAGDNDALEQPDERQPDANPAE